MSDLKLIPGEWPPKPGGIVPGPDTSHRAIGASMSDHDDQLSERRNAREVERLRRFLTRIASTDELTGDGPVEPLIANPAGAAAYELRARMRMAQRGLDGDEYP